MPDERAQHIRHVRAQARAAFEAGHAQAEEIRARYGLATPTDDVETLEELEVLVRSWPLAGRRKGATAAAIDPMGPGS